jgi:preprotein translocase subunit SecG
MFTFLVAIISVLALLLILIILLQSGKGGGLAAEFGGASSSTDSVIGGRQAATVLTKATWVGGGSFLFLAVVLAILSARSTETPESILRSEFGQQPATAPTSVLESEAPGDLSGQEGTAAETGEPEPADSPGETDQN